MEKNVFEKARWDIFDSTYYQVIQLKNGFVLKGYSKRSGFDEKNDKQSLLINWIIRMHKSGYLDESFAEKNPKKKRAIKEITYFLNSPTRKRPILNLKYKYYEVLDGEWAIRNNEVISFLDQFYEALKSRNIDRVKSLYIHAKTEYKDPFDVSKKRFPTKQALLSYCHSKIEENVFNKEQATAFYNKYLDKHQVK